MSTFSPRRWLAVLLMAGAAAASGTSAHAQRAGGDDTRLRLDQGIDRRAADGERRLLQGAEDDAAPSTIDIDGTRYTVANNVDETGQALYIALVRKQWPDVRRFLTAYLALEGHDPMLALYAKGGLARQANDLAIAEAQYRALLALQPDFMPGRLELARVLFENRKDREALRAFRQARAALDAEGDKAVGVRRTIDAFLAALEKRRGWQGSLVLGSGYSSNLNQSSASYTCLLTGEDGSCLIDRQVPDPIKAAGINFEGTISRRVPLGGHSGLSGRALLYGDIWPGHGAYSQATLTTQLGYDHQTAAVSYTLAPTFDLASFGRDILYDAWGVRAEALYTVSAATAFRLELSRKVLNYRQPAYADHDGALTEVYFTGWQVLPRGWTLFGGPDFLDKTADDKANAYRQLGLRAGVNKAFGNAASLLAFASFRWRDHRAYSELLEAKRRDREQNYIAIVKLPALGFAGLTPNILVQHNRVKSSVDWLYSYRRTVASLRLEYAF